MMSLAGMSTFGVRFVSRRPYYAAAAPVDFDMGQIFPGKTRAGD